MSEDDRPPAPPDLGERGREFWDRVIVTWELTVAEVELLAEACRCLDELDALRRLVADDGVRVTGSTGQMRVHPALAQSRATRQLFGRLLAQLELPDEDGSSIPSLVQARARKAAHARWAADPWHRPKVASDGT
ncbi:P27 family phage terminase small subunit [Actinoplanes solisilvae]|uniref:P27 family phage terminase small subunit n=1 Tax=Actinoplanes solisilvae TaxID=2486853 RepID=UPI000FD8D983|nr:P27 family phage terminase small subunit [Actinoplanes solisilvae]